MPGQYHILFPITAFCIGCGAGNLARSRLSGGFFAPARVFGRQSPAESRLQPGLAAPRFVQNGHHPCPALTRHPCRGKACLALAPHAFRKPGKKSRGRGSDFRVPKDYRLKADTSKWRPKTHARAREKLVRVQGIFNTLSFHALRSTGGVSRSCRDE